MQVREWFSQRSLTVAFAGAAGALVAGMATGGWLHLPDGFTEGAAASQEIMVDDPGRAKWREVIASLGGLGATFVIPAAYYAPQEPETLVYDDRVDRELDALVADVDTQLRDAEYRHAQWAEDREWRRRDELIAARAEADRAVRDERQYGYERVQPDRVRRYSSQAYYPVEPAYDPPMRYRVVSVDEPVEAIEPYADEARLEPAHGW